MNMQQTSERADLCGRIIGGKYELTRQIAKGGMGVVYEARNTATYARCAVKLLLAPGLDASSKDLKRFLLESRSSSAVESDHIVTIFDAGVDSELGAPYIVMELLRGMDLRDLLARAGCLSPSAVAKIALQAATGLAKAHERGVIHRDIKPANVFLVLRDRGDYLLKLVDFGIAKVSGAAALESTEALTHSGVVIGTPAYMSPEQARGSRDAGATTDVWSLGVVMYELLSGNLPYATTSPLAALMAAIVTEPLPPLQDKAPWVPPDLARIVDRALHRNVHIRYQDAAELRDALRRLVGSEDRIDADTLRPPTSTERAFAQPRYARDAEFGEIVGDDARQTLNVPQADQPSARGSRGRAAWLVGLVVAVGAAAAIAAIGRQPNDDAAPTPTGDSAAAPSLENPPTPNIATKPAPTTGAASAPAPLPTPASSLPSSSSSTSKVNSSLRRTPALGPSGRPIDGQPQAAPTPSSKPKVTPELSEARDEFH